MSVVANVAINVDASKALGQLKAVDQASKGLDGGLKGAAAGAKGLGSAIAAALGPLLAFSTAVATVQKGLTVAFERGAAEQRLKNLASSTGEYEAALGVAAATADKFGMSQTEATKALADIYSRLKGVGFGLKETSQIYDGFNAIAKQSGIAGADAAGVFFQLSQALGKGKLNGDEFISVSERMPQLLDAIAQATGRSRGELSKMAQDGQITSEVLYKALSESAAAAGDLNGKLTEQQKAFNALGQVSDRLLNSIGQVFGPAVIKGAELFAKLGQQTAEWWDYLGAKVFPKFLAAIKPATDAFQQLWSQIPWDTIVEYIQGAILVGIDRIITAVKILSPLVGFVVTKFGELAQNPVFRFIAEQVGRLAGLLGLSNTEVSKFAEEQKKGKEAAASTVDQYSSMPQKIEEAKEKAKELKAAQDAVTKSIQEATSAIDDRVSIEIAGIDRVLSVSDARLKAEMAINQVKLSQAERDLASAKTDEQRISAAKQVLSYTIEQAKLQRDLTYAQIDTEVMRAQAAEAAAQLKQREIELAVKLAEVNKTATQEHYNLLAAATSATDQAVKQVSAASEIAKYQRQAADAAFEGAKQAANAAYQSNIINKNTQTTSQAVASTAKDAKRVADNLERGAKAAQKIQGGVNINRQEFEPWIEAKIAAAKETAIASAKGNAYASYIAGVNAELKEIAYWTALTGKDKQSEYAAQEKAFWQARQAANSMTAFAKSVNKIVSTNLASSSTVAVPAFATGGVVTKPTLGLIGEAGTEYIVPESKAADFATNYLSQNNNAMGDGGGKAPVINITTGPIMEQNGQRYVTIQDMERALQTVSASVFTNARSAGGRRYQGVR